MYAIEVTDTFGGEANYCWVRRGKHYPRIGASKLSERRAVIAAVRSIAGWPTSVRVSCEPCGDGYELRPLNGACEVAFVTWEDEGEHGQ